MQDIPLLCLSCGLGQSLSLATFLNGMGLMLPRGWQPRIASSWSMQQARLRKEWLPQGSHPRRAGHAERAGAATRAGPAWPFLHPFLRAWWLAGQDRSLADIATLFASGS